MSGAARELRGEGGGAERRGGGRPSCERTRRLASSDLLLAALVALILAVAIAGTEATLDPERTSVEVQGALSVIGGHLGTRFTGMGACEVVAQADARRPLKLGPGDGGDPTVAFQSPVHETFDDPYFEAFDQLGGPAMVGSFAALLGAFGIPLARAVFLAAAACFAYLAARAHAGAGSAALVAAALVALNALAVPSGGLMPPERALGVGGSSIDADLSLALVSMMLFLVTAPGPDRRFLAAGLVLGALAGVMNTLAVAALPAAAAAAARRRARPLALLACGALATALPWMLLYQYMCGSPVVNSLLGCLAGCRPEAYRVPPVCDPSARPGQHMLVLHTGPASVGGLRLYGLFNWPLHDRVVRTPGYPLPMFALLPLAVVRSLGVVPAAAALVGALALARRDRPAALVLALWLVPTAAIFSVQENWDDTKDRFLPPLAAAPALLAGLGLGEAVRRPRRGLLALLASCAVVLLTVRWLAAFDAPADERWYGRFAPDTPVGEAGRLRESFGAALKARLQGPGLLPEGFSVPRAALDRLSPSRVAAAVGATAPVDPAGLPGEPDALELVRDVAPPGSLVLVRDRSLLFPVEAAAGRCAEIAGSPASRRAVCSGLPTYLMDVGGADGGDVSGLQLGPTVRRGGAAVRRVEGSVSCGAGAGAGG